jgi:hypothetical protein
MCPLQIGYRVKEKSGEKKNCRLNIASHGGRCRAAGWVSICIINCDQRSLRLRLLLCRSTGSRVRKPGGGVTGRANWGCMVACGASQRASSALASDVAEVGVEFSEYRGSSERGCPRSACCVVASPDGLSGPLDIENWRGVRDASDNADGP